jgi:hypothetical protein
LFRSAPTSYPSSRLHSSSYCSVLRPAAVLLDIFRSPVYIFRSSVYIFWFPVYIFRSPIYIFWSSVYIFRFPVYIFWLPVYLFRFQFSYFGSAPSSDNPRLFPACAWLPVSVLCFCSSPVVPPLFCSSNPSSILEGSCFPSSWS